MPKSSTDCPQRREDLEINPVEDGYVVYDPGSERVHYLNATAAVILELCTGQNSPQDITRLVQEAFELETAPGEEVTGVLAQFRDEGLFR
ncbi:MAG: PqqD family protein [Gammaproteobacteria bacterium]|jgi:hypothetical protein|nr:PqqD family protein [Gammaproteobacteria bacterium]